MHTSIIIIMPDQLTDPIRVMSRDAAGQQVEDFARLQHIRTGEYAHDLPTARRYEVSDVASEHASDIVERRFIVDDQHTTATPGGGTLPVWSLKSTTLHPDRHDIAAWFRQANADPRPIWAAHLPVIVRDALRNRSPTAEPTNAVMVLPDRAALIASRDNTIHPLASIMATFTARVHIIDKDCHRSGEILAPIEFADGGNDQSHAAVVTRAQAVIAEAIVSSHEAEPIPSEDDFIERWESIISPDLEGSMKREDANTFVSPLAIIDDHQAKKRATIILATLRIKLGTVRPDIWLSYHSVYDLVIGRGGSVDYENDLRADERPGQSDKHAVLMALHEGRLPILNLSADRSGKFEVHDCETDVPGAIPLLRRKPLFTLSQAALAMTIFRQSAAHKADSDVSWHEVFGKERPDGRTNSNGAGTDTKVAEQIQPSEPDESAPETGHEDGIDNNVLATNDGSGTDQAATDADDQVGDDARTSDTTGAGDIEPEIGTEEDGNIPDTVETETTTGGDAFAGGDAELTPIAHKPNGQNIEQAIADALHPEDGGTNSNGAGTDKKVAEQIQPSEPDESAPETGHEDGIDNNVLATNDGSGTDQAAMVDAADIGRPSTSHVTSLNDIIATLTAGDQKIIDLIRATVTAKRRSHVGMKEVPSRKEIDANRLTYDKLVVRLASVQLLSDYPKSRKQMWLARQLWEHPARWPRFLLVINILPELHNTKRGRANSSYDDIEKAALATIRQCKLRPETGLKLDGEASEAPSKALSGGPHG